MIKKLEHSNEELARQIYKVFQRSYKIEAELIGTHDFPPLSRSIHGIKNANTFFYGLYEADRLAGVIEVAIRGEHLEIDSLTVDPMYFKKGIGSQLINYVLTQFEYTTAIVETAVVNEPAINLYKKHGFVVFKQWTPSHGIPKVAMSIQRPIMHLSY